MESATIAAPSATSHGESPLRGAVLGATPYKLVHSSKTPVLVVRP